MIYGRARIVHHGKRLVVCQIEVHGTGDRLLALVQATYAAL